MPYLIDGHNLIPKVGLRLESPDDEQELIARLQEFCRRERTTVEVYFDNAPPGQPASRRYGAVNAHFVRQGQTADQAIARHLSLLGRQAKNWVVVSSDHQVQAAARSLHAQVLTSEAFAQRLRARSRPTQEKPGEVEDVEVWLQMFRERKKRE
ncbi:MAG: NYN domain-containing protein [Anaerolineales bacterium]